MSSEFVPKILHQTWKTTEVPLEWRGFAQSWRTLHPQWDYRLWTDEANRAFIADHYPELLATYDSYSYDIERADVIRYCLLHYYGGVYVDLDIECLQPIDQLIERQGFIAMLEPAAHGAWLGKTSLLSNAFMASTPGHPFLATILQSLISNPFAGLTHRDVLEITGPLMLDAAFRTYAGSDVTVLPSHAGFPFVKGAAELESLRTGARGSEVIKASLIRDGTFAVHYWANSWVGTLAGELVNPDPSGVEGYDFFPGWDSPGHDVANVGRIVRSAAIACGKIQGAVAFNTDGFVKKALLPMSEWLERGGGAINEGLYVRKADQKPGILRRLLAARPRRPRPK